MRNHRYHSRGFSLLEVVLAMAVLVVGTLVCLTVMMGSSQNSEKSKLDAIAYKACQDMAEALMSMNYSELNTLKTWSTLNNKPLTFDVTAAGFPPGVQGTYTLQDVSDQIGFTQGSQRLWEITIRVDYQNVHAAIYTRRKDPNYQ
jgi:prepilin-type N-terminal cleavage/methylation domain-containing protein